MKKLLVLCASVSVFAVSAWALHPNFTENRDVDYAPHPSVGNPYPIVTRALGGIVFGDGYVDGIFRVANPLSTDGSTDDAANTWDVNDEASLSRGFGSGETFQGMCYDGKNYYGCGIIGTASCALIQTADSGNDTTRWTAVKLVLSADGNYSGCTAVAADTLVLADYNTGALQFFSISGADATAAGSAIANPNAGTFKTSCVFYYAGSLQKYFFTYMVDDNKTRRVDVFKTDGTPGGTTYSGTFCNDLPSNFVVAGHYNQKWATLTADPGKNLLVAAVNVDSVGNQANGFDAFDLTTVATDGSATPYQQVRGGNLELPTRKNIAGLGFFTINVTDFLAVTHGNHLAIYNMIPGAGIADWACFD
ncbi:MAG: hypothetical protein NTY46_16455 [Candidatus Sumerlaeota bacterium]|nr:hypothetical protein [Candidatus Sumerlaeota bacterium]